MKQLLQDIRYALRQLRKSPGFTITAVLTLSIGIASCTAIFSIVNAVLLQPLPFPHPDRLVALDVLRQTPGASAATIASPDTSYPNFFDWRSKATSFEAMTSYGEKNFTLSPVSGGEARRVAGVMVAADFFTTLGVLPEIGRGFQRSEERAGSRSVVISHDLWKTDFQQQRDVLGKTVRVNDEDFSIIGVMPEGFSFPVDAPPAALWVTMAKELEGKDASGLQRGWNQVQVLARLRPGASIEQAGAEMSTVEAALAKQFPDDNKNDPGVRAIPELQNVVGNIETPLHILFGAVAALLLIACANVAGLLLARATTRRGELAIRAALGASRAQIVRQVLVECITLSLLGGLFGMTMAAGLLKAAPSLLPTDLPRVEHIAMNSTAVLFALAASVITGVLFGVFPAWRMSQLDPSMAMRDNGRGATAGRSQHRLHSTLVIAETAICLVLLVGAGLLIRSFDRVIHTDPGFHPENMLTFRLALTEKRYSTEQRQQLFHELLPRLAALPGVKAATDAFPLPLTGGDINITFSIDGKPTARGDEPGARVTLTGPDFFSTLGIPLRQGRLFTAAEDSATAQPVVIVNDAFAKKFFPHEAVVGRHITSGLGKDGKTPSLEIVGVVGDVKRRGLTEDAQPEYYLPIDQAPIAPPSIALRVTGDPLSYSNEVRRVIAQQDSSVPVYRLSSYDDDLTRSTAQQKFQTVLLAVFASIALILAAIGLYAVLSYMVAQRTTELGLRMALGAQRSHIVRMVLARGLVLATIGLVVGLVASTLLTRFMAALLYGVRPLDLLTFLVTTLILLAVSCISGLLPAYRASSLDPMDTLRNQ